MFLAHIIAIVITLALTDRTRAIEISAVDELKVFWAPVGNPTIEKWKLLPAHYQTIFMND